MSGKIVLVARDAAPSGCFKRLEPILIERGFSVDLIIGEGKPVSRQLGEITLAASSADIVVLGMSSSPDLAEPELAAGIAAKKARIPYGFYGDVPRCWARARAGAWFEDLASDAAFYLGVTEEDADAAAEVFANTKLIWGTGNPLREEMAFPRHTSQEVRSILNIRPATNLVLAPGGQSAAGNMASWMIIIDALTKLTNTTGQNFELVIATHPGDRTPYAIDASTQKEMKLYDELISLSPIPVRIVEKDLLTTSEIVPGADIIVEFGSSIGIEGAYQNVPVVTLAFEVLFRRHELASGERELEAVREGISELVVASADKLAETIWDLLTPSRYLEMRARQTSLYPKPKERGLALRKIADAIISLVD